MKEKNVLRLLYVILVVLICGVVYCMVMVGLNGNQPEENSEMSETKEASADARKETEDVVPEECAFDDFLEGTGTLAQKAMDINGIKIDIFYMDTFDEKPIVILQHGLTSKKEDMSNFAPALAEQGYLVVTPDAVGHGEMKTKEELSVLDMVEGTSANFDTIIKYFESSKYVDTERVGLVGFSLGGLTSFYYTVNGSYEPKVVVSLCATPQFEDLIGIDVVSKLYAKGKATSTVKGEEKEALEEQIRTDSPYEALLSKTNINFFLLCGDADPVVPYEGNVQFYEAMQERSPGIELVVKEGQQHEVVLDDLVLAVEYLAQHL